MTVGGDGVRHYIGDEEAHGNRLASDVSDADSIVAASRSSNWIMGVSPAQPMKRDNDLFNKGGHVNSLIISTRWPSWSKAPD